MIAKDHSVATALSTESAAGGRVPPQGHTGRQRIAGDVGTHHESELIRGNTGERRAFGELGVEVLHAGRRLAIRCRGHGKILPWSTCRPPASRRISALARAQYVFWRRRQRSGSQDPRAVCRRIGSANARAMATASSRDLARAGICRCDWRWNRRGRVSDSDRSCRTPSRGSPPASRSGSGLTGDGLAGLPAWWLAAAYSLSPAPSPAGPLASPNSNEI